MRAPQLATEEMFDVVDQDDCVVEQLPRSQVHQRRLRHRAVHIFLLRSDGCLLVHKRSDSKEEFPSLWTSSASGHVSAGEAYDATAPRELMEELGIAAPVSRLHKFAACPETSFEFTVLYRAASDEAVRADADEIAEYCWMQPHQVAAWMEVAPGDFSPAFQLLFSWFLADVERDPA